MTNVADAENLRLSTEDRGLDKLEQMVLDQPRVPKTLMEVLKEDGHLGRKFTRIFNKATAENRYVPPVDEKGEKEEEEEEAELINEMFPNGQSIWGGDNIVVKTELQEGGSDQGDVDMAAAGDVASKKSGVSTGKTEKKAMKKAAAKKKKRETIASDCEMVGEKKNDVASKDPTAHTITMGSVVIHFFGMMITTGNRGCLSLK